MSQPSEGRYEIREGIVPSTSDTRAMGIAGQHRYTIWDREEGKPIPFARYRDKDMAEARIRRREKKDRERSI